MMIVKKLALLTVAMLMMTVTQSTTVAQDGDREFTPQQLALLSQVEASTADQANWASYRVLQIDAQTYTERVTVTEGVVFENRQVIESVINTAYDANPYDTERDYNSDSLLTVSVVSNSDFGNGVQVAENYELVINARYYDQALFMQALRNGGSETLADMPDPVWHNITQNPNQFEALQGVNLRQFLPNPPPITSRNPVFGIDLIGLVNSPLFLDLVADIELVSEGEVILNGAGAEVTTRQILITFDPVRVLAAAFADVPGRELLVAAFANDDAEMTLTLWLDTTTSRRIFEQYVFGVRGTPNPLLVGYGLNDLEPDGSVQLTFSHTSDVLFADINIPITVLPPDVR